MWVRSEFVFQELEPYPPHEERHRPHDRDKYKPKDDVRRRRKKCQHKPPATTRPMDCQRP